MGLKKAVWEVLRFELLWKLVFFFLINPLFSGAYHAYVSMEGLSFNGGHPVDVPQSQGRGAVLYGIWACYGVGLWLLGRSITSCCCR